MSRILIVDDEKDWQIMLAMRLESEGFEVDLAVDPIQAMSMALELKPDLMLVDIMMPAGGGIELLKNLSRNVKLFRIPTIVVSSLSDELTQKKAKFFKARHYFVKTESTEKLLEMIREVL